MHRIVPPERDGPPLLVRPLLESDLDEADRVARVAFGTFAGMQRPERFFGDAEWVRTRWRSDPSAALAAEIDGAVVGSTFATAWGSVGFLGPVTVHPDHWGQSVATSLLRSTMDIFARLRTEHIGLFTFGDSPKHVALYQGFGFWPRFLTAVMRSPVAARAAGSGTVLSECMRAERSSIMAAARSLTDAVHPGLDLSREIETIALFSLGDTIVIDDGTGLAGLAVCHIGAGTEAGSGNCYIKFGAVRPGRAAHSRFVRLIDACRGLAAERGASFMVAGVNAGRAEAWLALRGLGFRPQIQGVSMHRPNLPFYSTPGSFVIDDWR